MWHWLAHLMGIDNESGRAYAFWSGFGSDLGELSILGAVVTLYRHRKCKSCWRIARHPVENTPYSTCHRHLTVKNHVGIQAEHQRRFPHQHHLLKRKDGQR